MISYLTSRIPLLQKIRRKRLHKNFVYDRMLQTRNEAVHLLVSIDYISDVEVIRKTRKNNEPYFVCKISQDDLNLLLDAKQKLSLVKKYRRRLKLLNF
jgi:hypothetical protein